MLQIYRSNFGRSLRSFLYGTWVEIVYLKVSSQVQQLRNRLRFAQVPQKAIDCPFNRLEVPSILKAYRVQWIETHV
jgi:hypothetical protein